MGNHFRGTLWRGEERHILDDRIRIGVLDIAALDIAALDIAVLGPLRVHRAGVQVDVSAAMAQRMLALLIARGGEAIHLDALADAMWEGQPPRTARKTIQVYAHRLRRALGGEDRIEFTAGGYRLRIGPQELDAQRFEHLAGEAGQARAAGDPAKAASLLDDALNLWRGEAFAGIADLPQVEAERRRLEDRRLSAVEARLTIGLELGHHNELLGRLRATVAEHPFREGLRALLMLALYRAGSRAEALELYRETHRLLAEELGVEPMAELQRLHTRMLSSDPGLDLPAVQPPRRRFLPHDVTDFVGRRLDLDWLDARLAETQASTVIITAIAGAAGIGKTALAVRWAHRAASQFPDGQFYINLRGYDHGPPLRPFEALIHLLRLLGVPGERLPVDEAAASAMFRSLLAGRKALVLLDNARTAEQIRPLLPGDPGCLVVVTSREKLSGLIATEGAQRLTLGLLAHNESIALLRNLIGDERVDAEPAAAAGLAELCGHLPLGLRIAAAHLADRPGEPIARYAAELSRGSRFKALDLPDDEHRGLPAVFEQSYSVLPQEYQLAFRWLSVVPGPDFTVAAAAAMLGLSETQTLSILDGLTSCHLLEQPEPERYSFHDLLGEFARFLMRDGGDPAAVPRARLLDYLRGAAAVVDAVLHRRPEEKSESELTEPDAVRWMETERANLVAAVSLASSAGMPEVATAIARSLYVSFYYTGNTGEWIATFECALDAVDRTDDLDSKVFLLNGLGQAYGRAGDWGKALQVQREAVEGRIRLGDEVGVARARCNLATTQFRQGRYLDALAELEAGLEVLNRWGEDLPEAFIRSTVLVNVLNRLGRAEEAEEHLLNAAVIFRDRSEPFGLARVMANLGHTTRLLGRAQDSLDYLIEGLGIVRENGDRNAEAFMLLRMAETLHEMDRAEASLERVEAALAIFSELGIRNNECDCLIQLGATQARLGRVDQARESYETALSMARELDLRHQLALAMAGLGRLTGDQAQLAEAVAILETMSAADAARVREWLDSRDAGATRSS